MLRLIVLFNGSNSDEQSKQFYQRWYEQHKGSDRVSGSRTADMRSALVDYFKEEAHIMIATEATAEGINLQFCSLAVNYDLPWNPQRIEQRIGRCHRYGQKHDVVVNFLNRYNAADQRVYELLSEKFVMGTQQCAPTIHNQLQQILESGKDRIIEEISARNSVFFDEEMKKLEKWADDLKSGLEFELKELDREIKFLKTESKKILKLDEKLQAQKDIKELEKKRSTKRRTLFEVQDEIDNRKEGLIEGVEARLQQLVSISELFTIRWRVV